MYKQAFVLDVETRPSAAKLFSFVKTSRKATQLSFLIKFAGHYIIGKSEFTTALAEIRDQGVTEIYIIFTIEPSYTT